MVYGLNETPLIEKLGWIKKIDAPITGIIWCDITCAVTAGDGSVTVTDMTGLTKKLPTHDGACLAACHNPTNNSALTAGDDGKIVETQKDGTQTILHDEFGRFFDQIAASAWGGIAYADGKRIYVQTPDSKETKRYQAPSSIGGLAFAPKGKKLAASHYNAASVYWVGTDRENPDTYQWDGAHERIIWHPKSDFLVTTMQDKALHVWKTDKTAKHGRMGGYPFSIKSISWSAKADALATAGADGIILWPFTAKDGPIGKSAEQIPIIAEDFTTTVACHPISNVIAAGTNNGNIYLARREDGALLPIAKNLNSSITCLEWATKGEAIAFGTEKGEYGIVDFTDFSNN